MDWNRLGLDWAYPVPAQRHKASLQDPALGILRSQAALQGRAERSRANTRGGTGKGSTEVPSSHQHLRLLLSCRQGLRATA